MRKKSKLKAMGTVSIKVKKKDGTIIDYGEVAFYGPWYKRLWWKFKKFLNSLGV